MLLVGFYYKNIDTIFRVYRWVTCGSYNGELSYQKSTWKLQPKRLSIRLTACVWVNEVNGKKLGFVRYFLRTFTRN